MRMRGFAVVLLTFLATALSAAELHVPAQHRTIQSAIDASIDRDVIVVAPGTYREALDMLGKKITLRSSGGPRVTILDGTNLARSIIIAEKRETLATVVDGFTFRDGVGYQTCACGVCARFGGAIFLRAAGMTVHNSIFEDGGSYDPELREYSLHGGGAIFVCQSDLAVTNSEFVRNAAAGGGAIDFITPFTKTIAIERSTFRANRSAFGGAVLAHLVGASALTIADAGFEGNGASHGGGVYAAVHENSTASIADARFERHTASNGAGLRVTAHGRSKVTLTDSRFAGGVASFGAGASLHAADEGTIDVRRAEFTGHEGSFGAGLFASVSGTPGTAGGLIRIDGSRFLDNTARQCCDTGVYRDGCFIDGLAPTGNGSYLGGGADFRTIENGTIRVTNSLFAGNSAANGGGGAHASSCMGGTVELINNTIVGNVSGGLLLRTSGAATMRVANSIVRGQSAVVTESNDARAQMSVLFSNVEAGFRGEGNIDATPFFVSPAARDFRLAEGSPGIDAGSNEAIDGTIATDAAGQARFVNDPRTRDTGLGRSAIVDIGAHEFQPTDRRRRAAGAP